MFTGIVEVQGKVLSNSSTNTANRLVISAPFKDLVVGESIAVNGVCLTLLPLDADLGFDVSPETLRVTTLDSLVEGDTVNLERAMMATSRFGGHYVSGHVDTTAFIKSCKEVDGCVEMVISGFKAEALNYLLKKGSITLDGVSLTINEVEKGEVHIVLIPHTLTKTTLREKKVGDYLNVEFDYLTRIVAHQIGSFLNSSIMAPAELSEVNL